MRKAMSDTNIEEICLDDFYDDDTRDSTFVMAYDENPFEYEGPEVILLNDE
jgi:hypothetical protein